MWGLGTKFHERVRFELSQVAIHESWLTVVIPRSHFVFALGAVPVRFFRGKRASVKKSMMRRSKVELTQQQLAFPGTEERQLVDWAYRFAIDGTAKENDPPVYLVQHDTTSGRVGESWLISKATMREKNPAPRVTAPDHVLHGGVQTPAPTVRRRRKRDDAVGDE
jgi:hypothetical protein